MRTIHCRFFRLGFRQFYSNSDVQQELGAVTFCGAMS